MPAEEQADAIGILNRMKKECSFLYSFCGGVKGAERQCPLLWTPWYDLSKESAEAGIRLFKIETKSGELPTHPAVLGSILALGVERRAVGDIFKYEGAMTVALKDTVAPYVKEQLFRVGKERVELCEIFPEEDFEIVRETERIVLSVSSMRLDCVVAALCRLSREEALSFIASGRVLADHRPAGKSDMKLSCGSILSIRGYGRFRLAEIPGTTKSGRLRLVAEKYK